MSEKKDEKEPVNETKLANEVAKDVSSESEKIRPNLKKFLIPVLRRATYRWKARDEAYRAARKERGRYECASCKELFGPKEIDMDHVDPVVSLKDGFIDWNTFIDRLFPEVTGWQVLCKLCHELKTIQEDSLRSSYNQKKKAEAKKSKKKSNGN